MSSSITHSNFSTVGRLGLTDSNDSLDASSESLESSLAESLLNSESDWIASSSTPTQYISNY